MHEMTVSDVRVQVVRKDIKNHAGQIPPEDVSILFFGRPNAQPGEIFLPISVNRQGQLDQWPSGFFDEMDHLLDRLLEPIRETTA